MKTCLLLRAMLAKTLMCLITMNAMAQALVPDRQWLVREGHGKSGWIPCSPGVQCNAYDENTHLNTSFVVKGVAHPERIYDSRKKNDVFIIYADGHYYSSRSPVAELLTAQNDPFYPRASGQDLSQTDHLFQLTHSAPIKYMYLTNRYETDDPPDRVKIQQGGSPTSQTPYVFHTTSTPRMTANQDVVPGTDITLVIPSQLLQPGDRITAQRIRPHFTGSYVPPNKYFRASPAFPDEDNVYTNALDIYDHADGSYTLKKLGSTPYIFIALRPTDLIDPYRPRHPDSLYKAVFRIERISDGQLIVVDSLEEFILASHDPNQIKLLGTCTNTRNGSFAYYRVRFQNTGLLPADSLSVELCLPKTLDRRCLSTTSWSAGGRVSSGTTTIRTGHKSGICGEQTNKLIQPAKVFLTFEPQAKVDNYNPFIELPSIGYVDFCIRLHPRRRFGVLTDLAPLHPIVKFGQVEYPITDFIGPQKIIGPVGEEQPHAPVSGPDCKCPCSRSPL